MTYPEQITTIDNFFETSYKERGSIFIGQVCHCETENDANDILTKTRKKFYDATHRCYACKFTNGQFNYSDDGEPKGTAGVRIFNAIEHFNLFNVLVVVIRYFGGAKLGAGPLGRAYYTSAFNVLEGSEKIKKYLYKKVLIESDFKYISHIHRILSNHHAIIDASDYEDKANFECFVKPADLNQITDQLTTISKGEIQITITKANCYK